MAHDPTNADDLTAGDRMSRLKKELADVMEVVHEQEQEIVDLETRMQQQAKQAEELAFKEVPGRKGEQERREKAVAKERARLEKIHAQAIQALRTEHTATILELQTRHKHELEGIKAEHDQAIQALRKEQAAMEATHEKAMKELQKNHEEAIRALEKANDDDTEAYEAEVRRADARVEELQEEVEFWKSELHRAKAQLQTVIEHAAQDVAEAELNGRVRNRNGRKKENAAWAMPKDLREALLRDAEDTLWEPKP